MRAAERSAGEMIFSKSYLVCKICFIHIVVDSKVHIKYMENIEPHY